MKLKLIYLVMFIVFFLISARYSLGIITNLNESSITTFSHAGVGSDANIMILNPYTYLHDNENWTVAFNTTGKTDLIISSTNANWTELLKDNPSTKDEMKFLSISCGKNSLKNSLELIDENGSYYFYSDITSLDSIRIKDLLIRNYSCNDTGYLTNNMIKAGYAILQFNYGDQVAYAYDLSTWNQTTESDFEAGVPTGVNTSGQPGNVTIGQRNCWGISNSCNSGCQNSNQNGFYGYTGGGCSATSDCYYDHYYTFSGSCNIGGSGNCLIPGSSEGTVYSACNQGAECGGSCTGTPTSCDGKSQSICNKCPVCSWWGGLCDTGDCSAATTSTDCTCGGCTWTPSEWYWSAGGTSSTGYDPGTYCSFYKYNASGSIASKVFDSGKTGNLWRNLSWSDYLPSNTNITFEVRASDTSFAKTDASPSWTSAGWISPNNTLPSGRYIQWRANLSTTDYGSTPTLYEVNVTYDNTAPTYSNNSTNSTLAGTPILHSLKWTDDTGLSGYILQFCNGTWNGANCLGQPASWSSSLSGWQYRKSHNITNATGADVNYQIQIIVVNGTSADSGNTVYINNKMRSDFGDIRFTNSTGSLLNYWMESVNSGVNATFWVQILGNLTSTNQTIYIYYGNITVTNVSNGDNTFLFFDDFPGTSINTTKWSNTGSYETVSNSVMTMIGPSGSWTYIDGGGAGWTQNVAIRGYIKFVGQGSNRGTEVAFRKSNGNSLADILYFDNLNQVRSFNSGTNTTATSNVDTNWDIYDIKWVSDSCSYLNNNVAMTGSPITTNIPNTVLDVELQNIGGSASYELQVDWILARKYVGTEPAHSSWGNEETAIGWVNDTWNNTGFSGTSAWSNVTKTVNSTAGATIAWCVYANDTSNNWNGTSCSNPFTYNTTPIWGWSNVTTSLNQTTITYPYSVAINCTVRDANTSSTISGYTVWIYDGSTLLSSANTDGNGNVTYNYKPSAATTLHNISCNITNNVTLNYNASSNGTAALTVNKGTPALSIGPLTSVSYGASTQTGCQRVSGDSSSTLTLYRNNTQVNSSTNSPINETSIVLGAGTYNYTCTLSGTDNYTAGSNASQYRTVTPASNILSSLTCSPSSTVTYPTQTTCAGNQTSSGDADVTYYLYRNDSQVDSQTNANTSETITLGANTYVYRFNSSSGQNYTANNTGISLVLTVVKNSSAINYMNLTINGTESNETFSYLSASNATGWYNSGAFVGPAPSFTLYRNSTNITSTNPVNDTGTYGVGLYVYTYNTSGNTNYSSASKQFNLTITSAAPTSHMFIGINGSQSDQSIIYPNATNVTAWKDLTDDGGCVYNLYRSTSTTSTLIGAGSGSSSVVNDTALLGVNNYTYVYNTSGCTNYSASSVTRVLNVTRGNPFSSLSIYIDGSASNKTINYPNASNVSANSTLTADSDCTYNLWRNNTNLISGKNVWNATLLGNDSYAFKYNMTGQCTNWTSNSSQTLYLYVNKGSANLVLTSNVSWNTSYPNASNVTGYGCPTAGSSDFNCTLYRDTSGTNPVANSYGSSSASELVLLGTGPHLYVWNMSIANPANWTFNSTNNTLAITSLAKVDQITLNSSTIYNGTSARISCSIKDYYTDVPLSGYNVSFYNDTFLGNGTTDSTGWASYDYSDYTTNTPQNITLKCNITDQSYYNASSNNSKNITLSVVNLGVQASASPMNVGFGSTVVVTANITNNVSAIDSVVANISYTNVTDGVFVGAFEIKNLTFNQSFSGTNRQYSLVYTPPRSGDYIVAVTANSSRISSNTTNFSVSFGQPSITFTFPNYRVMANQTFNVSINLSSINGDVWYTNLTLGITNQSVMNITQNENFSRSQLYSISNGSTTTVNWNANSLSEGLTTITVDAAPANGSSAQGYESHKVIYPLLLVITNITNVTLNATLRTMIIGNTSGINSVNLNVAKAYSQDTDSATSAFTQNLSEVECTGETLGSTRVTLLSAGAHSNVSEGNRTINNDYGDSWASVGDLIIFLNGTYTIDRFSIYWKNVTGSGNATIYFNTSSGWATIPSLSNLIPPVEVNFTNISGFSPIVTNAFKFNQTNLASQIYEFEAYQVQGRTDKCYIYDFNFSNTTRSGNYSFNASVQTQNSLLSMSANSNSTFFVNFGSPTISISASDIMLTNYNETYKATVTASNGDLRNVTLNLTIFNQSVLNITPNETWDKTISEILSSNSDSRNWTVVGVTDGLTNTSVFVNSSTGEGGYISSSNFSINVTSQPGDFPNVTNFWFSQYGSITNQTNLYANLTIYANATDDVSLKTVIANITYPDNESFNATMTGNSCHLPQWCVWSYTFGGSNLPLNMTGKYTIRVIAMDIGGQEKASGKDTDSPENMNFQVYDNYTLNLTSNYNLYMGGENITVQSLDINNFIVDNASWVVNVTKINETINFTDQKTTFNYTVQPNDPEGNYSIIANASKDNNTGSNAWQFDVSRTFTITDVSVMPSINPSTSSILNIQANLNNARNVRHNPSVSGNLFCINSSSDQYQMFEFDFTNGSASLIGHCISPSSYSTPFNITINVSDEYNNSGQYIINLTTSGQPASFVSGGGGGGGGGYAPSNESQKNCSDGTFYGQCSSRLPYYCSNGTLIQECSRCGCDPGYGCQPDSSCRLAKAEDFNFTLDVNRIEIKQGEDKEITGSLKNTGNTVLELMSFYNVSGDCCNISMLPSFELKEKEEKVFTILIHAPLAAIVGDYPSTTISIGTGLFRKDRTVDIIVGQSPYYSSLSELENELTDIENNIQEVKKAGIDTAKIEAMAGKSKALLQNANNSIASDQIDVLSATLASFVSNNQLVWSILDGLRTQAFLLQNAWLIGLLVVMSLITVYMVPQVLLPLDKKEKEFEKLKKEEEALVISRVETEKQYFMRKIDENTFSQIMIGKQEKILKLRAQIRENENERTQITKSISPLAMATWFANGIKGMPHKIKNSPKSILNRKNKNNIDSNGKAR